MDSFLVNRSKSAPCGEEDECLLTLGFSPDGRTIAAGDSSGIVHLLSARTGEQVHLSLYPSR